MNPLTLDEATARAREWRAEASCSPVAAVAIALLNRLEELDSATATRERERPRDEGLVLGQWYGLRHFPDYLHPIAHQLVLYSHVPALGRLRWPFQFLERRTQQTKFGPLHELARVQFLDGPQAWIDVADIDMTGVDA